MEVSGLLAMDGWMMDELMRAVGLDFVPRHILGVMERLHHSGFDVWVVGGALRDVYSGRIPKDYDLATSASTHEIMRLFPHVIPVGIQHGTVRIHLKEGDIEVTTFEKPGWEGILSDLSRRDFTMNALALSYPGGRLVDPHGGRSDLRSHLLRAVGNARSRLREDPLRILRAARFMSTYGCRMAPGTAAAVKDELIGLEGVAVERIREEMFKLLPGKHMVKAFEWMRRCGVLRKVLPELQNVYHRNSSRSYPFDLYRHTLYTVRNSPLRLRVRLAALFHDLGKRKRFPSLPGRRLESWISEESFRTALDIMNRWRMSQRQIQEVGILVKNIIPPTAAGWEGARLRRLMAGVGQDLLEDLLDLSQSDRTSDRHPVRRLEELKILRAGIYREMERGPALHIRDLAVKGEDVMRLLHLKPGPHVGEVLRVLYQKVLDDPGLNRREALIPYIHDHFKDYL